MIIYRIIYLPEPRSS